MKTGQTVFRLIPLLVFVGVFVMLINALSRGPLRMSDHMVGKTIGAFDIPELDKPGSHFTPEAWKGKVALVNIFATWCEPCQAEHPVLLSLSQTGKVPVYGIAWKDKEQKITQWLNARGNPYKTVGLDHKGSTTLPFSMTGVPETFLIDKSGVVRYHYNAALTDDMVKEDILPLVEKLQSDEALKP